MHEAGPGQKEQDGLVSLLEHLIESEDRQGDGEDARREEGFIDHQCGAAAVGQRRRGQQQQGQGRDEAILEQRHNQALGGQQQQGVEDEVEQEEGGLQAQEADQRGGGEGGAEYLSWEP